MTLGAGRHVADGASSTRIQSLPPPMASVALLGAGSSGWAIRASRAVRPCRQGSRCLYARSMTAARPHRRVHTRDEHVSLVARRVACRSSRLSRAWYRLPRPVVSGSPSCAREASVRLLAFVCPRTVQNCFVTEAARSPLRTPQSNTAAPHGPSGQRPHTHATRHQLIRDPRTRAPRRCRRAS